MSQLTPYQASQKEQALAEAIEEIGKSRSFMLITVTPQGNLDTMAILDGLADAVSMGVVAARKGREFMKMRKIHTNREVPPKPPKNPEPADGDR